MKKLLTILFCLSFVFSFGQKSGTQVPSGNPTNVMNGYWYSVNKYVSLGDSGMLLPRRDTNWLPLHEGALTYWQHTNVDSTIWIFDGLKWKQISTGSGGSEATSRFGVATEDVSLGQNRSFDFATPTYGFTWTSMSQRVSIDSATSTVVLGNDSLERINSSFFLPNIHPNICLTGCTVTPVDTATVTYTYIIAASTYYLNNVYHSSPEVTVTLSAADATNNRVDYFVLQSNNTGAAITGTPANPALPPDYNANTQLPISFATVAAGTVAPTNTTTVIYKENAGTPTEFAAASNSANINVNSTNNPYAGSKVVEFTTAATNNAVTYTWTGAIDFSTVSDLNYKIRSKGSFGANKKIRFQWFNGVTPVGVMIPFGNGSYGFASGTTGSYQNITIPLSDFGNITGATLLKMTVSNTSGTLGSYIDNIILINDTSTNNIGILTVLGVTPISVATFNNTAQVSLINSGVSAATYGDATHVGQFAVTAKGIISSASNVAITGLAPTAGTTGQVLTKNSNTNYDYSWATPTTGTVTSVALAAPSIFTVTGSPVTSTGTLTFASNNTTGDIIYGSASNTLAYLSDVSAGSYLRSGGVTTAPLWSTVKIPNTAVSGDIWMASATNTITALAKGSDGQVLTLASGLPSWATPTTGTVTSFTATDGNGFDFTVTNSTTTPTLTATTTVTDTRVMYSNATAIAGAAGMTFDGTSALTLGVTNTTLGKLLLKGNTSGTVTINSAAAAGTWTLTLPTTGGTNNYVLTTNGSGVSTWTDVTTIATGTVTSFSAGNLSPLFTTSVATSTTTPALTFSLSNAAAGTVFANVSTSSAAPAYTSSPVLGAQTVATGSLGFSGTTSGVITVKSADAAGTWTFTLPTTGGTNNYVLSTNGSGTSTWTDPNTLLTGAWLLASGGTLSGTNTITAGTNPIIFSTGVTSGTGATAGIQVAANSLTTGNGFDASSSSITTGNLMKLTSTSTAANAFALLNLNSSGANASSTRTATGQTISVTNSGTTSTNVGLNITASGATNNYALITGGGNVGIGTSTPTALLHVAGGISISAANIINGSVINIPAQTITDNTSSGSTGLTSFGVVNIGQPTIAASSSTTYTGIVSTLQIANAPTAGTNMTLSGSTFALSVVAGATSLQATTTNGLLTSKAGITMTTTPALAINSPATIVATNNAVTASTTAYTFIGNNTNTQTTGYIRGVSFTSVNGVASSATANIGTVYGFTSELRTQANNATALPNAIGFYSDYMLTLGQTQKVTTVKQFYAAPLGSGFIGGTAGDQTIQVVANSGNVYGLMIDSSNAVTFGAAAYNSTTATATFWGVYVRPNSGGTLEYNQLTWTAVGQADATVPTSALMTTSLAAAITSQSNNYTATASDHTIIETGTTKTVTLPTAVGIQGRIYIVKLTASSTATVATTSSQTIDGSTTYSLSAQYKYVAVQSDNANWHVIANNGIAIWIIIPLIPTAVIMIRRKKKFYEEFQQAA